MQTNLWDLRLRLYILWISTLSHDWMTMKRETMHHFARRPFFFCKLGREGEAWDIGHQEKGSGSQTVGISLGTSPKEYIHIGSGALSWRLQIEDRVLLEKPRSVQIFFDWWINSGLHWTLGNKDIPSPRESEPWLKHHHKQVEDPEAFRQVNSRGSRSLSSKQESQIWTTTRRS